MKTPDQIWQRSGKDLLDTLAAHKSGCVGMAANMIGVNKHIIAFDNEGTYMVMFNPVIVKCSGPYEAEEGCPATRPPGGWSGTAPMSCGKGEKNPHFGFFWSSSRTFW